MGVLDRFLDAIKLNDDYDDYDDEYFDDEADEFEEDRPRKRFFRKLEEEEDFDDVPPSKKKTFARTEKTASKNVKPVKTTTSSKVTPMRSTKRQSVGMEVSVIKPTTMEDARMIADTLLANCTVVLNLEGLNVELAQRIVDFASGASYSIGGSLQKISSYIFLLTPANVDITGDYQEIINGTFEAPPIRTAF